MEEHLSPLAVTHLLQHTLRTLCIHDNSQWVYAVFWRILPRNYPPPKWDGQGAYDRSRGNRRNWILVWEDGFCNFAASSTADQMNSSSGDCPAGSSMYGGGADQFQHFQGLQPELFFKMSHEIYNYGEGLIGKAAADHSHKWIHKEPNEQEINFLSAWHNSADSQPRTWEAQFQSGIKTIALIAVREGVVQLGAVHKVVEDLSYVVMLRKKFSYLVSIPGVLLPHPSSAEYPGYGAAVAPAETWHFQGTTAINNAPNLHHPAEGLYHHHHLMNNNNPQLPFKITPSMSSLEALLSKLPSVVPPPQQPTGSAGTYCEPPHQPQHHQQSLQFLSSVGKEDNVDEECHRTEEGETSGSISAYHHRRYHRQQQQYLQHEDQNLQSAMGFDQ